jgi:TatD DNase family protein
MRAALGARQLVCGRSCRWVSALMAHPAKAAAKPAIAPEALFRYPPDMAEPAPMLVDIGANLSDDSFQSDVQEVWTRAQQVGVGHCIITGTSLERSAAGRDLAHRLGPGVWFTAGVHPHDAKHWKDASTGAALTELAADAKCVAIGECGLDFNRNFSSVEEQEHALECQLELAVSLHKPLFVHCRDAAPRLAEMLLRVAPRLSAAVVVHCFTGSVEEAGAFLQLSPLVHIGITGWICDEREGRAAALGEVVRVIPEDRLLLETDAPYLIPRSITPSKARPRRNEPCLLPHVAAAVAAARGVSVAQVAEATTRNAVRVFGLAHV